LATYRRETARHLRTSFSARSLIAHFTEHGMSTNDLYCQKLEALTYIFATDSLGLCWLLFAQLSLKVKPSESKTASTKTEFYMI